MRTLRKKFVDVPRARFGKTSAYVMKYNDLSNLLMTVQEFKWYREVQNNILGHFLFSKIQQENEWNRPTTSDKNREHLLRLGCDSADISDILPNCNSPLLNGLLSYETATYGISPQEAVAVAKLKFGKHVEVMCENPDCHAEVTCFKFTLTKNQNNKYNIECGDHKKAEGSIYWRHKPSAFRCAVWQSWIGKRIQGTCQVCNDSVYCTLHVLDMWELCHDVARTKGGQYSLHNIVPGSRRCNSAQRTLTIAEYRRYIRSISPTGHYCHVTSNEFGASFPNATRELLEQFCDPAT